MRRDVRILLVGDGMIAILELSSWTPSSRIPPEGVGKSTIVTSLIKESFVPHVSSDIHACRITFSYVLET